MCILASCDRTITKRAEIQVKLNFTFSALHFSLGKLVNSPRPFLPWVFKVITLRQTGSLFGKIRFVEL